jgi:eukaryotic-like serine/threonine-protein kinase
MTAARRYEPLLKIASGGTAAVYVGTAAGALGFRQLVAIKIPHAHLADDAAFRTALLAEARIAARLHHANVVDVRDVEVDEGGVQLVMDYVEGASLSELIRAWTKEPSPRPEAVAIRIVLDACEGLRALHELSGDDGASLGLVHRDVSPANVLVGLDGVARIADFGLAKSLLAVEKTTSEGTLRGKLGYMAPEYVRGKAIDARIDVFAMGVVLWEALARRRLFRGENDAETLDNIQRMDAPSLTETAAELGTAAVDLDAVVTRALAKDRDARFPTIAALSADLERVVRAHDLAATHGDVRDAFPPSLRASLDDRRKRVQSANAITESTRHSSPPSSRAPAPAPQFFVAAAPHAPPPPPRSLFMTVLLLALIGGTPVSIYLASRSATPSQEDTRRPVLFDREIEPLAGDANARAPSSSSPLSSARAPHTGARLPPRASSDEPGKKPPRPNPYASAPAPR